MFQRSLKMLRSEASAEEKADLNVASALDVLLRNAKNLMEKPEEAEQLTDLLSLAQKRLQSDSSESELPEDFKQLLHLLAAVEDDIEEIKSAGQTVLDWIAKGGRSLGLD